MGKINNGLISRLAHGYHHHLPAGLMIEQQNKPGGKILVG
jgi:hypothetical protein